MMATETWFASWFESPWYMRLYNHRTSEEAQHAVALAQNVAHIPIESHVLDLCCGYGRHALALAETGYHVTGIDQSAFLIHRANENFGHANVSYAVGDMRGPYPGAPYDAIVNFFTSYGYFDTDEENRSVIATMAGAVKCGGIVLLDFLNAKRLLATLEPETVTMIDGACIVQERWIDEPFVRKRITITNPCSQDLEFHEQVWLYSREDLEQHFVQAGLTVEHVVGNYAGDAFDADTSERCIVIGRKP